MTSQEPVRRRFLAPEVVQTSAMDCGPATLKCLLEGFGIPVSYGRLREACQTDVDGTSIDTLQDVAVQLGLRAEQNLMPADDLLLPESCALPAIVVVTLPSGVTHFVVVWRRHGPLVQVMDPATGRCWLPARRLLERIYVHEMSIPADRWRAWAAGAGALSVLRRRLSGLRVPAAKIDELIEQATSDAGWRLLARLDAASRTVDDLVRSRALRRGAEAVSVFERLLESEDDIPASFWAARQADEGDEVLVRGAVLVRVRGHRAAATDGAEGKDAAPPMSPELVAAMEEPPSRPGRELLRLLRADGVLTPGLFGVALALAAGAVLLEALLFRGLLEVARDLGLSGQRMVAIIGLLFFLLLLLLLELPLVSGLLRYGRRLETRLRLAFLHKIPRLRDRYFQSRLSSDMAERGHSLHQVRHLPELAGQLARSGFELLLTAAGIAWLDPRSAPLALLAAALALAIPLFAQPVIGERDLRLRTHTGALTRFYFDALLGLVPIRAHGAERAVRREHEGLLSEWARAGAALQRAVVGMEGLQFVVGFGLAAWLVFAHLGRVGESGSVLLLIYWALNLPVLGQEVALAARQYPELRNLTLRLLEPLGAKEDAEPTATSPAVDRPTPAPAPALTFEAVSVQAAGHTILDRIDLAIASGEHVAIVGPSGAGKSTLAGVLLGWHTPRTGRVLVEKAPLDAAGLERLRARTAWVDPTVQLWNRSFLNNLRYGRSTQNDRRIGTIVEQVDLLEILERLPDGMQTPLGEGGALLSGGEGQRVRLGRAMLRSDVRLAILDEPFRGLDRERRRMLLERARRWWKDATLLCITHDVGETRQFDRVIVIEAGRLVEDGVPAELAARAGSRYRAMLEAEAAVREGTWSGDGWRHVRLADGRLVEKI